MAVRALRYHFSLPKGASSGKGLILLNIPLYKLIADVVSVGAWRDWTKTSEVLRSTAKDHEVSRFRTIAEGAICHTKSAACVSALSTKTATDQYSGIYAPHGARTEGQKLLSSLPKIGQIANGISRQWASLDCSQKRYCLQHHRFMPGTRNDINRNLIA